MLQVPCAWICEHQWRNYFLHVFMWTFHCRSMTVAEDQIVKSFLTKPVMSSENSVGSAFVSCSYSAPGSVSTDEEITLFKSSCGFFNSDHWPLRKTKLYKDCQWTLLTKPVRSSENSVRSVFFSFHRKDSCQNHTKVFFFPFKWKLCKLFHVLRIVCLLTCWNSSMIFYLSV